MKKLLLFLLLASFVTTTLWSQKITINARIDSTVLKIGDQTQLFFEVTQQPNQKVSMPLFSDSIMSGLEIVEPLKVDTVKSPDGQIQVTHRYLVSSFQDSLLYIPSYPFVVNGDTVWSKSLSLKVVQPFKIDTASNQITDIKPVMAPKFNWMELLIIFLWILALHGLIVLLLFLYRKYFKKKTSLDMKSQELLLPPHVVAFNYLDKLKQEKAWQHGRFKEYHTELTDVIRTYIERVFNMNCLEMTSEEILEQFRLMRLEDKLVLKSLQQILQLADLVKFAKWDASPDEHELSLTNAYLFVNQTKIEDVKPLEADQTEK